MTRDLLTRLRSKYCCDGIDICNCDEAADEIERLRDEIARKDAALEKIANGPRDADLSYLELFVELKMEARAALALAQEKVDD